jgi:hypothetical protein
MGQFTEGILLGKEGKNWAPSPGPGRPGLGFLGAGLAPPLATAALAYSPSHRPRASLGRG